MQARTSSMWSSLLVVILVVAASQARPPSAETSFGDVLQDGGLEGNSLGVGGPSAGAAHLLQDPQDSALAALQFQMLQQYANNMRPLPWEQFLRSPQEKRQIRYRQCYFNPISCFRK